MDFLSGGHRHGFERESTHGFLACIHRSGAHTGSALQNTSGMGQAAALSDEVFHRRKKFHRLFAVSGRAQYIIDPFIFLMPPLVKGHGGFHQHALLRDLNPMQKAGHMAVIPQIVSAAAIHGNRGTGGQDFHRVRSIFQGDRHNFHIVVPGNEGGNRAVNIVFFYRTPDAVPHKPSIQGDRFLLRGESAGFLHIRGSQSRENTGILHSAPEVPNTSVIMQVFNAHRLQQKAGLVYLRVSAAIGGDGAFQSPLRGQGEVEIIGVGIAHGETAMTIRKGISVHFSRSFPFFASAFSLYRIALFFVIIFVQKTSESCSILF